MKALIVGSLEVLSTILLVVTWLIGLVGGWMTGDFIGAIVGLIVAFVASVLTFGMLFILMEMNENLRAIRAAQEKR